MMMMMMRLSCHRFDSSRLRFWLRVIAYNLDYPAKRLVLQARIHKWSRTSLQ
jgi:hypothetical protein